ncbi:SusC/RagA family TonB-linked outer membrane protein [Pontibacter litorisediminis]|uniref:SusC/RagA family TonB-linked outer membrane protein n=1 Tax=Pontibacter litorisediminis TaxID=1846260 RepID=UPI0023EBDAA0|nr:TonB-dependent receptor [Pontibacter litorisediminis]
MKRKLLLLVMCLLTVHLSFAQNTISVQGRVTDAQTGQPLIGAGVVVQGTTTGTQTDATGNYTLNAPADGTLSFSYLGYKNLQVPINNRTTVDAQLQTDAEALQEVVVVGYGVQEKRDITGSISSVEGEEIARQASQNPVSNIQGKVAGVQITNSGQPGASPTVRIRGTGSVLGDAGPLYVVDGTIVENLSFLNPNDIASMEILKDASSAAIYGLRAANGVVLVTTKRGKAGEARINYNGFVGVQRVTNKVELANAQQYAELINQKQGSEIVDPNLPSTDWYDEILRTATIHNHQVSLSGGSDRVTYSASGGYLNQEGIIDGNKYERITARLQTDFNATEHLKLGYNAIFYDYNSDDVPNGVTYQAFVVPPVVPVFKADGNYGDPANFNLGTFGNPRATLDSYNQESSGQRLTGNTYVEANFLNNFTFRSSLGLDYAINEFWNYQAVDSLTTSQVVRRSLLTKSRSKFTRWLWENTLTYDKQFGDHEITALLGYSAQEDRQEDFSGRANDVPFESEATLYLSLGDPETFFITNTADKLALLSYFGRVNYNYKNRYLLTATLRRDGSSKFPEDERFDYFPAVGLGWVVSEEPFMQNQQVLDYFKLRGSWGKLGNSRIPSNITILRPDLDNPIYTAVFGGVVYPGGTINLAVPPTLFWEVVKETDIGAEFAFLNNRLTAEIDWYNRETEDAIFNTPLLATQGTLSSDILGNFASFRNRGLEFIATWNHDATSDFSYSISGNFSTNRNKVTEVATGLPQFGGGLPVGRIFTSVTRVGDPIGAFYGYEVEGIFQNEQEIANSAQANVTNIAPGDFRYRDLNGDNEIDANDKTIIGNPNPGFYYGLNTNFRYKNWDFQLDFQGVGDVDVYNANKGVRFGNENYTEDFYEKRWSGPGSTNAYPGPDLKDANIQANSWFVEDGSYMRIRNLQLGYTLPSALTSGWKMERVRFYVNAQNPVTWFDYTGFTPEVGGAPNSAGVDLNVYPLSATYNFGVDVNF